MAGHLGDERVTTQNLTVVSIDEDQGLIFIKGSVPGGDNGWVLIRDAVKIGEQNGLPFPAAIRQAAANETASEEPAVAEAEEATDAEAVGCQRDRAVNEPETSEPVGDASKLPPENEA